MQPSLPQINKLRTFSSINAMEDESGEGSSDIDFPDLRKMAVAKDDEMRNFLHNQISENLPAVCDFSAPINFSTLRKRCLMMCFSASLPIHSELFNPFSLTGLLRQRI